jgi:virulence-associated protein VapD
LFKTGRKLTAVERIIKQESQKWYDDIGDLLQDFDWQWVDGGRFVSRRAMAASTSTVETQSNAGRQTPSGAWVNVGGAEPEVDARIRSTLLTK